MLYKRFIINSFKSKFTFRFDYIIQLMFSFFYIILQVFIWKGLYGNEGGTFNGISLNEMIAFTIFSSMTRMLTESRTMMDINKTVLDGSIAMRLLLPIGYRKYYFFSNLSENLFWSVYQSLPPIIVAIIVFGLHFEFIPINLLFYCISVAFAYIINFLFSFILGLSVIWLRNAHFLDNFAELVFKLFSGSIVPMWFFPKGLNTFSNYLPFRYVIFEPISILMGKTPLSDIPRILAIQVLWIIILYGLLQLVWHRGRQRLMIHGG